MSRQIKRKTGTSGKAQTPAGLRRPFILVAAVIMIIGATGMGKIYISNSIKNQNALYSSLQRQEQRLGQKIVELQGQITELGRPDRIRAYARKHLDMIDYQPDVNVLKLE